jgi:HEAT repeat protein
MTPPPALSLSTFDAQADPLAQEALRGEVQEVVRGIGKALRTHLLYEGSGPAVDRFMETLQGRMAALWERTTHFTVQVEEHELVFEGAPVYQGGDDRSEDLAFLLYKDGVRELSFWAGFEERELAGFVELLARIHRDRSSEEDLLTLLWDHDWLCFRYRYVEPLEEGVQVPASAGGARAPVRPAREEEPSVVSTVSREDFREALYFLDDDELRRLEHDLRLEMHRDLWTDVLNGMLDRLQDGPPARQEQVVGIVSDLLPTLLAAGRLETAAYVLGELVGVATGGGRLCPAALRGLRGLFEQLGRPETVGELVRIVEESGDGVPEAALGSLFSFFPPEALAPLLRAGETVVAPAARRAVMAAAERLGGQAPEHALRLAGDEDAAVAGGAARLLGRLRVANAGPEVAKLLKRPEVPLRVTAVEALQELRSAGALEGALEDAEREVRVAAARALGALRYAPARPRLEAALDSKRLREADLTERIAFFEAYGDLAGEAGTALLDRLLNGKNWLGRREPGEIRACAALGLGRIRHPGAERALTAAAADPDPVVRSAVGRALRSIKQ